MCAQMVDFSKFGHISPSHNSFITYTTTLCCMVNKLLYCLQEKYFTAYQSFISEKAIYVLCWKTQEGEKGIQKLKEWLLLIKVKNITAVCSIDI